MNYVSFTSLGNIDNAIGGRILMEFEVFPKDILSYQSEHGTLFLDVTRQMESAKFFIPYSTAYGNQIFDEPGSKPFPWNTNPQGDNEMPNDDTLDTDEDNIPFNSLVYSFDGPSIFKGITDPSDPANPAFKIIRINFKEFIRIYFGDSRLDEIEVLEGSRISHKFDWHTSRYTKRNEAYSNSIDLLDVSYCYPRFMGMGNGTVQINLLSQAVSHGYSLDFDDQNNKWSLKDYYQTFAESTNTPNGWQIVLPEIMNIAITQGTIPFSNGDSFEFNIFKTANPDGKENKIAPGQLQDINGPK